MKTIKTLLAVSALATITSAADATVWSLSMSANVYFPAAAGPLQMIDFSGTWDDVTNAGVWTGTAVIPGFKTTMHYTQAFSMNEATGSGSLNPLDVSTCTDNIDGNACSGFGATFTGNMFNTAVNPPDPNDYKIKVPFTPSGWSGQWTLQINKVVIDPETEATSIQYIPMPLDVTFAVPVPAAAWLFSSGLIGLAGIRRRRAKVH